MPADLIIYYIIAVVIFGLAFGSFLNVCIYRIPRDLSVVAPRSFCPECGKDISWYDNIPVLSFANLRGKCRHCGRAIGLRYPVVEVTTAALFALTAARYGWSLAALKWIIFESILVVLFWTDVEERILPDELTIGGTVAGLILAAFVAVPGVLGELLLMRAKQVWQSLFNAVIGGIFLAVPVWLIGILYERVRKRQGLGLGDVKLLALMGVFLGLEKGLLALFAGALAGSVLGLGYLLITRKDLSTYELPFGSFLCLGAAVIPLFAKIG